MKFLKILLSTLTIVCFSTVAFAQQTAIGLRVGVTDFTLNNEAINDELKYTPGLGTSAVERKGFVFGLGVGGSVISIANSDSENPFDEAQGGISLPNLKLGWMVSDRLALLATFPGMTYEYEGRDRSFDSFIPSVQYWLSDRWWVNGGVGLAVDSPALYDINDSNNDWNFGGAVSFSTGIELVQKRKYVLDLQTRIHMGQVYLDNDAHRDAVAFTVGLGFNWY